MDLSYLDSNEEYQKIINEFDTIQQGVISDPPEEIYSTLMVALLETQNYQRAADLCINLICEMDRLEIPMCRRKSTTYVEGSVGYWMTNQFEQAKEVLVFGRTAGYQEASRLRIPLMMYTEGVFMEDEKFKKLGIKYLKQKAKGKGGIWTNEFACMFYVLEMYHGDEIILKCEEDNEHHPTLKARTLTWLYFYAAVKAYEKNDMERYLLYLQKVGGLYRVEKAVVVEHEYHFAKMLLGCVWKRN